MKKIYFGAANLTHDLKKANFFKLHSNKLLLVYLAFYFVFVLYKNYFAIIHMLNCATFFVAQIWQVFLLYRKIYFKLLKNKSINVILLGREDSFLR